MSWSLLVVAGLFEVCWAVGLKMSDGFSKLAPTAFTIVTFILSFIFLFEAIKGLPIGTAYAVWTGIGAVVVSGTVAAVLLTRGGETPACGGGGRGCIDVTISALRWRTP